VGYVAQLDRAPAEGEVVFFVPGPARTPLREDVVRPDPLALPAADLAPEWREGYFVVPKLGAMEEP
jgi:Asp-tRNA(Asn)/Glu-tRNA(Gln) amidotransferase C subunit